MNATAAAPQPNYRFGFVLTTAGGNMTRYLNLRKYAERDPEVECVWAPCSHYLEPDPYRAYPNVIRARLILREQARPVLQQVSRLDAVMFHAFEPYVYCAIRSLLARKPLLVWSQDNPPASPTGRGLFYPGERRSILRQRLRFSLDKWCLSRTALSVPWSDWAAEVLVEDCRIPASAVQAINVGLDLELWRYQPKALPPPGHRMQVLFVGGEFQRKGGDLLMEVFARHFADVADLHLVTKDFEGAPPPRVYVHKAFNPNDEGLLKLYADADLFVLPTRADMSSLVAMEAMATGLPVIITRVGGIPDIVRDGETGFLIDPDDGAALADRMRRLLNDPARRQRMGADGRAFIAREYSAEHNVARILETMKQVVQANGGSLLEKSGAKIGIDHSDVPIERVD